MTKEQIKKETKSPFHTMVNITVLTQLIEEHKKAKYWDAMGEYTNTPSQALCTYEKTFTFYKPSHAGLKLRKAIREFVTAHNINFPVDKYFRNLDRKSNAGPNPEYKLCSVAEVIEMESDAWLQRQG